MNQKKFALVGGITMLILGVLAFYPAFSGSVEDLPDLNVEASYGVFLNTFPMNVFDKLIFIFLGIAGIAVASKERTIIPAVKFSRWVFWIMSALTFFGLFRQTNTLFGYWPLYGNEVWLHIALALIAGYYGYNRTAREALERKINEPGKVS